MPTQFSTPRWMHRISLVAMTVFTLIAIAKGQITVFYVIYLFWWDELLKTIFDVVALVTKHRQIPDSKSFRFSLQGRFFFLAIYIVFIVVFFGFLIDHDQGQQMIDNLEIFFFKNPWFTFTIIGFFIRELSEFLTQSENEIHSLDTLSPGIITLHISIILGGFLFGFFTWNKDATIDIALTRIALILPFLLLKLFFEWNSKRYEHTSMY